LAVIDACLNEKTVIKLLISEGLKPTCIHKCVFKVYGEAIMDVSTVQQCARQIKEDETGKGLHDKLQMVIHA
jgi:hypothetical protein